MHNLKEWISDNLRYILLGLAIVLILVAAFFAVKFIGGIGSGDTSTKSKQTEAQSEPDKDVIVETTAPTTEKPADALVEDEPKVLETVQAYYAAVGNKDIETLKKIVPAITEEEQQVILNGSYIESYNNIKSYSKKGPVDGTYVTYACFDCKVTGVETLVPNLVMLYLEPDAQGNLVVGDYKKDEATKKFVEEIGGQEDVQTLIADVKKRCDEAEASDENLKNLLQQMGSQSTESNIPQSSDAGVTVNKLVAANTECNVRADANEEAEILGLLTPGETVTRVQELDNGWSEVRYGEMTGYVMSEFLAAVSTDAAQ